MSERLRLARRVSALMEWDAEKTALWFRTPNPMLGEISPDQMILAGRSARLADFIEEAEYAAGLKLLLGTPTRGGESE